MRVEGGRLHLDKRTTIYSMRLGTAETPTGLERITHTVERTCMFHWGYTTSPPSAELIADLETGRSIQSNRFVIVRHEGDLLNPGRG